MADHIPFVTGADGGTLAKKVYADSDMVRLPLERVDRVRSALPVTARWWLDPGADGMDDVDARRGQSWFDFMKTFDHFEQIGRASSWEKPVASEIQGFVKAILDRCAGHRPGWISVPQVPLAADASRNRINRALAAATGRWKSDSGFAGRLILPFILTHQNQINGKTARNPRVQQAERCYDESQADGLWVVDQSLRDDSGSSTLNDKRFPGVIGLHEELNERISSKIRIGGPYWGLNLVLWSRGLVDYPAIGLGSGYQFFLSGGRANQPSAKVALPSLRRRVGVGPHLRMWLDQVLTKLAPSHPSHAEFSEIRKSYSLLSEPDRARERVAIFYKKWFNEIASVPPAGRSMALFQDLSAAYALGKSLPDLVDEGSARRPEAVAESLMLSCL